MKSSIFISYSRKDYDVVITLRNEIYRRTGVLPWMDVSGIETGTQFADVIATAIDECDLLVFAISPNSVVSHWTTKEVLYAQEQRKKIYPVVINDVRLPRKLALLFADVDRVDIQNPVQCEKFFSDLIVYCDARKLCPRQYRVIQDVPASFSLPSKRLLAMRSKVKVILDFIVGLRLFILVTFLVGVFLGVPVYILVSRLVTRWIS